MNEPIKEKPKEGLYKTICPHCNARLMVGRSATMRSGINIGITECLNCKNEFALRMLGDSQTMESCKIGSNQSKQWSNELFRPVPVYPHLESVV